MANSYISSSAFQLIDPWASNAFQPLDSHDAPGAWINRVTPEQTTGAGSAALDILAGLNLPGWIGGNSPFATYFQSAFPRAEQQATASSFPYDTNLSDADQGIDALISGSVWDQTHLTFSFPSSSADYEANYANAKALPSVSELNATQKGVVYDSLAQYAAISGLTFSELTGTNKIDADLRYARSNDPSTAYAYYPNDNPVGGDSMYNTSGYNSPQIGNYEYHTFLHETGHALGLKHGQDTSGPGAVPYEMDSMEFTVMTYRSWVGKPLTYGYANEEWGFSQSLMMLDIAAIQRMYGANFNTEAGNTTYSFSITTGEMFIDGVGVGTPGGNRVFRTVWDGDGIDTYDFSNYSTNLAIDLTPGGWSDFHVGGNFQRAMLEWGYQGNPVTYARGHLFNALQYEGDPRSLIENAKGGSGDDHFIGNAANNMFEGGAGNDSFVDSEGNDTYYGDDGQDDVTFAGAFADFVFETAGTLLRVISDTVNMVVDLVADTIETIFFDDQSKSFDELFALAGTGLPIVTILSADDDVGSVQGVLTNGDSTDDTAPVLEGTISSALEAGQSVRIYRDGLYLDDALVTGTDWTFADVGLLEGSYDYTAQVVDTADSGPLSASFTLIVDQQPPAAPTVARLTTFDATPVVTGTAVLASGETLAVTIAGITYNDVPVSGDAWSVEVTSPLADGTYEVVATVTDAAGNSASDGSENELIIDTSSGEAFYGSAATSDIVTGTEGADVISGLEQGSSQQGQGTIDTLTGLGSGDIFILGTATTRYYDDGNDRAGNNGKSDYALITDFGNGADRIELNGSGYLFETISLNGVTGTGIFHNVSSPGFDSRDELIGLLQGVDPADLITSLEGGLTIVTFTGTDTTAPVVTVNSLTTTDTTPQLTGTIDDPTATISVTVASQTRTATNNGDGSWTLADNALTVLAAGTYDVAVSATDGAGNVGSDSTSNELTIEGADTTAPVVTVDPLTTNDTKPVLTGTIDDPTASISVTVDGETLAATNNGTSWSLQLTTELADGPYDVAVSATDGAGNVGHDATIDELVIDTVAPFVLPTVDAQPITNDTTPLVTGTATLAAGESLSVLIDTTTYDNVAVTGDAWSVQVTAPLADGTYDVVATVSDAAGNSVSDTSSGELIIDTSGGAEYYGFAATSDVVVGSEGADIISGLEEGSTEQGQGTIDTLTGLGGNDLFILGTPSTVYYDDGNDRAGNNGKNDYALITDFDNGDTIQLSGQASDYVLAPFSQNGADGTGIFHDVTGDGFDGRDELIGLVAGLQPDQLLLADAGLVSNITFA